MGRRLAAVATALLFVSSGSLSGCADDEASSPTTNPTTSPAASPSAPATTTTRPCERGGRSVKLDGVRVRQFCGPALAEVTVGEELLVFPGGECTTGDEWLSVNIGFEVVDPGELGALANAEFHSFTVLLGRHPLSATDAAPVTADGVSTEAVVTFAAPGRSFLVSDTTVTVVANRSAGALSGNGFLAQAPEERFPVEGAFTCDATATPLEQVRALVASR